MRRSYPIVSFHPFARRRLAALACLVLAAGGLAACSGGDGPDDAVDAFLAGWKSGKLDKIAFVEADGRRIASTDVAAQLKDLTGELAATPPALSRQGDPEEVEKTATAGVAVDWTLPGGTPWTYQTRVRLTQGQDDVWSVVWEPTIVHEKLKGGDTLELRRERAERGGVLDGAGKPLVTKRDVVLVGVEPGKVEDPEGVTRALDAAFKAVRPPLGKIDVSDLPKRIAEAKDPSHFMLVLPMRKEQFEQIRSRIYDLPGTMFPTEKRDLAPTREFARALLGTVDPALKEDIDKDPALAAGDVIGHGGIQGAFDKQLRGTPGVTVVIAQKDADGDVTEDKLFSSEPKAGEPVKTTLDVNTQNAADTALTGLKQTSALVAVRVSDGAVLAAANGPNGGNENLAFTAQVPPGSTFKMVTGYGLLAGGHVSANTPVDCPKTFTVEGRSFKNSDNFELGKVPFHTDFAKSCNTAFASLAPKLGDDGLASAGRDLGLESSWDLGLDAYSGKVSTGGSGSERAAAAFGQGTTLVSPLAMASATASVAKGSTVTPRAILSPAPGSGSGSGGPLEASALEPLRAMMREVVTSGTATTLRDVPGGPVSGKTGTAEYDDNPANTHAWFVGWQGDVAFAVFVEKGGASGATAVPAAEKFLRALH